ncbi:hypothetical protein SLS56_000337 [Neofusicoccum ribis]|uniref:Uncharacterized protein n=1 Tax=Neofusicoccum ribis TaxID=45134 RepID=A0ABR3TEC5_9PEZI
MHFSTAGIAILIAVAAAAPAPQDQFDPRFSTGNRFTTGNSLLSRPQSFGTDTNSFLDSLMNDPRVTQFLQTRPDLQNTDPNTKLLALQQQFPDLFQNTNNNFNSFLSTDNFDPNQFDSQRWNSNPNRFSGGSSFNGGFKRRIKRDAGSPSTEGGFNGWNGYDPFQQLQSIDPGWRGIDDDTFQSSLPDIGTYLQSLETDDPQLFLQIMSLLGPGAFQQSYNKDKREAASAEDVAEDVAKE